MIICTFFIFKKGTMLQKKINPIKINFKLKKDGIIWIWNSRGDFNWKKRTSNIWIILHFLYFIELYCYIFIENSKTIENQHKPPSKNVKKMYGEN